MKNYQILSKDYTDATKGFEIQDPDLTFISWDMPAPQVLKEYGHLLKIDVYEPLSFVSFLYPVRVGNVILENFGTQFGTHANEDDPRPFKTYEAHCINSTQGMHGFAEIHQNFLNVLSKPIDVFYHQQEFLRCVFDLSGVNLVLYKQTLQQGYVLLRWVNDRSYPHLLENTAYEKVMQISAELIWENSNLHLDRDYMRNLQIKETPLAIRKKFADQTLIWRDDRNQYLGFSKGDRTHIYNLEDVDYLSIKEVDDVRIGFHSELNVHFKTGNGGPISVIYFSGDPGKVTFFVNYKEEIENVTQRQVKLI